MSEFFTKKRMNARLTALASTRSPHIIDWQKITQVIRPSRGTYLSSGEEVSKRPTSMINSTPAVASRTLQAGMISGASSPAYQWFKLELDDKEMMKWGPAKVALEQRETILMDYLARSNFYQILQTVYGDSADFGTGLGLIDLHPRELFTAKEFSPGQYYIDVDENGDIDTIYAEFFKTTLQLVSKYSKTKCSKKVQDSYDKGNYNDRWKIIQIIEPNQDLEEGKSADWRGKPWVKFTYEEDVKTDGEAGYLEISGYEDWPGFDLRWDISSGNIWGQGPGLLALGDAAALQTYEFRDAQAVEKSVKPPLGAPIFLKNRPVSHAPGGVTYYDPYASNGAKVEPLYTIQAGVLQALDAKIMRTENRVNEVYYKDLFLMLATTDRREITAREVEEKHQEKLLALGPVLQRTHRDALSRAIIRVYKILVAANVFPPAPSELNERQLTLRYTSALAYAQRSAGATSIERFFGFMGNLVGAYPKLAYKVKPGAAADYYADAVGVPAEIMVPDDQMEKDFGQAQQAAAAPEQAKAANDMASAAQLLSQTDTARPNALNYLLQRGGLQ